jgi:hypothetical protein
LLDTWTGATDASAAVVLPAGIAVCSQGSPAKLYKIDPAQPAGSVTTVVSNLGDTFASGIAFDGARVWTANNNSLSIVTPTASIPWTVTTVTLGFSVPNGVIFDGANIWMTDFMAHAIRRLDAGGAILQTITIAGTPQFPAFDGSNLWVPDRSTSVIVIRVSTGAVLTTLTGNGLDIAWAAGFDGERVLVTNFDGGSVSIWKAADLVPLGVVSTGAFTAPVGACSDGLSFWVTSGRKLLRI